jgi:HPt (histidine-containing phosphotransfer) domain-containing protein
MMKEAVTNDNYLLTYDDVVVDISMLYDVAANDEAYIKLMADTFLKTVPAYLTNINESFQKEDFEALYQSAHKMKSTLSIVKINDMLEWVKQIEQYAKQKNNDPALAELLEKVNKRFLIAIELLQNKFA